MKKFLVLVALSSLLCVPALAQDFPRVEIFGGYSIDRVGGDANDLYDAWDEMIAGGPDSFSTSQWFMPHEIITANSSTNL